MDDRPSLPVALALTFVAGVLAGAGRALGEYLADRAIDRVERRRDDPPRDPPPVA